MILLIFYTFIYILFVIIDLIPLYENKQWKLFCTYTSLLLISYTLLILIVLDIKIPSPAMPIKNAVSAIFGLSE